eukprot:scaffold36532_cov351-Amphora_coffeaeformis.AAC.1
MESLASQLRYCQAANKASSQPCPWMVTNISSTTTDDSSTTTTTKTTTWNELQKFHGYDKWRGLITTPMSLDNLLLTSRGKGNKGSIAEYFTPAHDCDRRYVYLSGDATDCLSHDFWINHHHAPTICTIFIVGGLVDRSRRKGLSAQRARDLGLPVVRLPIGKEEQGLATNNIHSLNVNHVFALLLKCRECHGDWPTAVSQVLPQRYQQHK